MKNITKEEVEDGSDGVVFAAPNHHNSTRDKSSLLCGHCNREGHDRKNCFQVIWYLEWRLERNINKKKIKTTTKAAITEGGESKSWCLRDWSRRKNSKHSATGPRFIHTTPLGISIGVDSLCNDTAPLGSAMSATRIPQFFQNNGKTC